MVAAPRRQHQHRSTQATLHRGAVARCRPDATPGTSTGFARTVLAHRLCALSAPVITAAAPYNVASAVASVTLTGMDFGPTDGTVTGLLALGECGTASWASATSVSCIGTRGAGETGTAGLTVASVAGTSSAVFSFDGREIGSMWSSGQGFCTRCIRVCYCAFFVFCTLGNVCCSTDLWHPAPVITAVSPYNVVTLAASVTLTGMSFAPTDTTVTALLMLGGCSTAGWVTATSVTCIGSVGGGMAGTVGLTVAGIVGTSGTAFSFDGIVSARSGQPLWL